MNENSFFIHFSLLLITFIINIIDNIILILGIYYL
jgi:hypothetical protein